MGTCNQVNEKQKRYVENRNAAITANIQQTLGQDFELPTSNGQMEALNRIKDAGEQARVWQKALAGNDTRPVNIRQLAGSQGSQGQSQGSQGSDQKSEGLAPVTQGKLVIRDRMVKLENALSVVEKWENVNAWVRNLEDPKEQLEAYRVLDRLTRALIRFGQESDSGEMWDSVNRIGRAIRDLEAEDVC